MKTALVRCENGNLKTIRDDYYTSNMETETELRGNGYKVLKIWNGSKTAGEVDDWEFLNRK